MAIHLLYWKVFGAPNQPRSIRGVFHHGAKIGQNHALEIKYWSWFRFTHHMLLGGRQRSFKRICITLHRFRRQRVLTEQFPDQRSTEHFCTSVLKKRQNRWWRSWKIGKLCAHTLAPLTTCPFSNGWKRGRYVTALFNLGHSLNIHWSAVGKMGIRMSGQHWHLKIASCQFHRVM